MVDRDPGVVRRAACRSEMKVMFAVRVRLVRSSLGPASTCIEDLRERTGSAAACSARPQQSYRVRHRRLESWTSSQDRRGLCQAPDTTSASRAQKVEERGLRLALAGSMTPASTALCYEQNEKPPRTSKGEVVEPRKKPFLERVKSGCEEHASTHSWSRP